MPQLDKLTFMLQYSYLIIFFLLFYISFEHVILPTILKIFITRGAVSKEIKSIYFLHSYYNDFLSSKSINYLTFFLNNFFILICRWITNVFFDLNTVLINNLSIMKNFLFNNNIFFKYLHYDIICNFSSKKLFVYRFIFLQKNIKSLFSIYNLLKI